MSKMNLTEFYKELDDKLNNGDSDSVRNYLESYRDIAEKTDDMEGMIAVNNELGTLCRTMGSVGEAKKCYRTALVLMEESGLSENSQYADILMNYGEVYVMNGELEEAAALLNRAKLIFDESDEENEQKTARICNSLGSIYMQMGQLDKAEKVLTASINLLEGIWTYRNEQAAVYLSLAQVLRTQSRFDEAKKHVRSAINIFQETGNADIHYASAQSAMGELLYLERDYKGAAAAYEKAANMIKRNYGICPPYQIIMNNLQKVNELI